MSPGFDSIVGWSFLKSFVSCESFACAGSAGAASLDLFESLFSDLFRGVDFFGGDVGFSEFQFSSDAIDFGLLLPQRDDLRMSL